MINFTEHSTAEDIINELNKYVPYLDENYQFINKYRNDFIYHYSHNFYNLALFSFHYVYMFIISTSMVKYYSFKKDEVIHNSGHDYDLNIELFAYFGRGTEKKAIKSLQNNPMLKRIKHLHIVNVSTRDYIAHSSGIKIKLTDLIKYVNDCFIVLNTIQPIALSKCFQNRDIQNKWNSINSDIADAIWTKNQSSFEDLIVKFLIDYHLSFKDVLSIKSISKELNAINFLLQFFDSDENGNYFFVYNDELDLHHSLYDTFTSKYEPAFSSKNKGILDSVDILNILKDLDETPNKYIAYNVFDKLMEDSKYWVPFGSQKMKEKQYL